jgi:hypothetical protein
VNADNGNGNTFPAVYDTLGRNVLLFMKREKHNPFVTAETEPYAFVLTSL